MAKRRRSSRTPFPDRFSSEIIRWTATRRYGQARSPVHSGDQQHRAGTAVRLRAVRPRHGDRHEGRSQKSTSKRPPNTSRRTFSGNCPVRRKSCWPICRIATRSGSGRCISGGLPSNAATSFVGEFGLTNGFLKPRRAAAVDMRASIGMNSDVVFIVSRISEKEYQRASALGTTDDDQRGGIATTFDGRTIVHRFYHKIPGMVGLHSNSRDMTAAHEFKVMLSSPTRTVSSPTFIATTTFTVTAPSCSIASWACRFRGNSPDTTARPISATSTGTASAMEISNPTTRS